MLEPLIEFAIGDPSKDVDMMAPEVRRDLGTFAATLDVFAIGRLLAQLRRLPAQAMDVLPAVFDPAIP